MIVGNGVLFLIISVLTSAKHCPLISIWSPPLVTHGYTLGPQPPIFLELRGQCCLLTVPSSSPRRQPLSWRGNSSIGKTKINRSAPCWLLFQLCSLNVVLILQQPLLSYLFKWFFLLAFHLSKARIMREEEHNVLCANV